MTTPAEPSPPTQLLPQTWTPASRPEGPTTPDGVPLARFGQRVVARFIDGLIITGISLLIGFAMWWPAMSAAAVVTWQVLTGRLQGDTAALYSPEMNYFGFLEAVIAVLYEGIFLAVRGQTPGKAAAGISVRLWHRPGPPPLSAVVRRLIPLTVDRAGLLMTPFFWPFTLAWYVNVLWPLWDRRRQALHDKLAGTVVVQTRS